MSDEPVEPVEAVRVGPGQILLAAERVTVDLMFATAGQTFRIVSPPVDVGGGKYLATLVETAGPSEGRQLTAQLQVGRRVD
ncbi:hypothetical protein [Kribbella sp. NPDC006257]|uniref:hypothetical protein n=1 Tax=Kribbella sp. NPDC006257 TaxID=3156738 RepID=UPI0033BEC1FA